MRWLGWVALGVLGWAVVFSTREDESYSSVRVVGLVLLAIGSIKLLPRYPAQPAPTTSATSTSRPIHSQTASAPATASRQAI